MFNDIHASAATAARPKDSLGCLSSQLRQDLELDTGEFKFYRKCTLGSDTSPVAMDGSGRGFLIGVSLQTGHRRRIYSQHAGSRTSSSATASTSAISPTTTAPNC